jgi:Zn-dependent peptidase ImmA (M78 family)
LNGKSWTEHPVGGRWYTVSEGGLPLPSKKKREVDAVVLVVDRAREDAEKIAADFTLPGRFPVDVEDIANQMGIRVEYTYLEEGVSGMIVARPDEVPVIFVDERDSGGRQRFTIAHELGHYVERINQGEVKFAFIDRRGMDYDLHEFYADEFAGNLLMPREVLEKLQADGMTNLGIAKYFDVSPTALNKRLERLSKTI